MNVFCVAFGVGELLAFGFPFDWFDAPFVRDAHQTLCVTLISTALSAHFMITFQTLDDKTTKKMEKQTRRFDKQISLLHHIALNRNERGIEWFTVGLAHFIALHSSKPRAVCFCRKLLAFCFCAARLSRFRTFLEIFRPSSSK